MWAYNGQPRRPSQGEKPATGLRKRTQTRDTFAYVSKCGKLVERSTRATHVNEPVDLFQAVIEEVNTNHKGAEQALRAIKTRLTNDDITVVLLTLRLLEACVAQCHREFVALALSEDMLEYLKPLAFNQSEEGVKARELLQCWVDSFLDHAAEFRTLYDAHAELRMNEVDFPRMGTMVNEAMKNLDSRPPIPQEPPGPAPHVENALAATPSPTVSVSPPVPSPPSPPPRVSLPPAQVTKLQADLEVVRSNIHFLTELLSHLPAGDDPESNELLMEVYQTTRAMEERVHELISRVDHEQLIDEATVVLFKMAVSFELFNDAVQEHAALNNEGLELSSSLDMTPESSAIASFIVSDGLERMASSMASFDGGALPDHLRPPSPRHLRRAMSSPAMMAPSDVNPRHTPRLPNGVVVEVDDCVALH